MMTFFRISYNSTGKWNLDIDFFQVLTYTKKKNAIESIAFLPKACLLLIQKNMPIKLIHMLPILYHIDLNQ